MKLRRVIYGLILSLILAALIIGCQPESAPHPQTKPTPEVRTPTGLTVEPSPTQDVINVLSTSTKVDFPKALTFNLKVRSKAKITRIELRYKVEKTSPATVITTVEPDFEPAPEVKTSWTWDMRKASLPPGAELEYYWVIADAAGNKLKTNPIRVEFNDLRHKWQELKQEAIRLFWYQGGKSFGQELMAAAQKALDKLAKDTGARLKRQVKIYIYANSQALHQAMIYPQEWTGGVAFPEYNIIALGISPANLIWGKRAVAHELAHLVIHQITFNPYVSLPTWLDEGLAMYAEGELRKDLKAILQRAIAEDRLFSVRSLCSPFPAHAKEASLCYAESYSLVKFLISTYGSDKMLKLLQVFKQGSSYDEALLAVYNFDLDGLETLWRANLGLGPRLKTKAKGKPAKLLEVSVAH